MEIMMSERFANGDRVRIGARPEWGIGTITKVEAVPGTNLNGHGPQRLSVRFPNAGMKTLVTGHAELIRVTEQDERLGIGVETPLVQYWNKMSESDWLGSVAKRKVEEAMMSLPPDVKDPFNSLVKRLSLTLGLYRFDRSGKGLIDWAVAQTGLDDPLSRFTRPELEQKFERWCYERDNHLAKLLQEAKAPGVDQGTIRQAVHSSPPAAQQAVRRITGSR
jgi:hypothetical protein